MKRITRGAWRDCDMMGCKAKADVYENSAGVRMTLCGRHAVRRRTRRAPTIERAELA